MADRIKNYSLGSAGVVLDPHHLLPGVSSEGMTVAQNATHDSTAGFGGALRKRPGFARFNNAYAGGVILGGIMMPVAQTGGAPAAGGGAIVGTGDVADGTSVGTGNMTGAPGAVFSGSGSAAGSAIAFTGGVSQFGGVRVIAIGLDDNVTGSDGGRAWYLTSKNFANTAVKVTTPRGPSECYSFPTFRAPFVNGIQGQPSCIGMDGRLYYCASRGSQAAGGVAPDHNTLPIWVTNGATASQLATLTTTGTTDYADASQNKRLAVMALHAGVDGFLYAAVKGKFDGQDTAGSVGHLFRIRPTTGEVVEWNGSLTTPITTFAFVPVCCNYFAGYLYFGEYAALNTTANVYASDGTVSVQSNSFNSDNVISTMCQYNGRLFTGTGINKTVPTLASLFSKDPNTVPTGGVGWSVHAFDAGRTVIPTSQWWCLIARCMSRGTHLQLPQRFTK